MEEKKCSRCNLLLPLDKFNKNKSIKGGFNFHCRTCVTEKNNGVSEETKKLRLLKRSAKRRNITLEKAIEMDNSIRIAEELNKKYCYGCEQILDKSCFYKSKNLKGGLNTKCKPCVDSEMKQYYIDNRDKMKKSRILYRQNNRKYVSQHHLEYINNRRKNDDMFRLSTNLRARVKSYLKSKGARPTLSKSTYDIIGCTAQELREHIENKFVDGMSWDNYGTYGWHLDHIIPLSSANTKEEIIKLNHYTNLQPLWAIDNLKKGGRIIETPPILP